jgi:signal peptidase
MSVAIAVTSITRRTLDLVVLALILVVLVAITATRLIPAITGAPSFVVAGGSMEPAIHLGSVVLETPVPVADLAVGDVVSLVTGPSRNVFTHRITRVMTRDGAEWIATQGDANASPDPSIVPASDVVGRVSVVVPGLGYLVQMLDSLAGAAFLVSLGLVTFIASWLLEILENDLRAGRRRRLASGEGIPTGQAAA